MYQSAEAAPAALRVTGPLSPHGPIQSTFDQNTYRTEPNLIRIGRAPDNDIVLDNPSVSRYHAQLRRQGSYWLVEDLGSVNGVAVGHPSNRVSHAQVKESDVIYLGTLRVPVSNLLQKSLDRANLSSSNITLGRLSLGTSMGDPWLPRQVATIIRDGQDVRVAAAGNTQCVFLNGSQISGIVRLQPGDCLQVGSTLIRVRPDGAFEQASYRGQLCIDARQVGVRAGPKWLIRNISFSLYPRELVALMGPSGAGKTTLLMALCGYLQPAEGDICFNGESLYTNYTRFSSLMGYVPQDDIMHRELTVREALYFSARLRLPSDYTRSDIMARIDVVLKQLGLEQCADVLIGSPERKGISGGQRKRVNLGIELLTDPIVLFLDEPTSGLSSEDALLVVKLLRSLADHDKTIVVTIHQPGKEVFELFDNLLLVAKDRADPGPGQLAYYGPAWPEAAQFFNPTHTLTNQGPKDFVPDDILRGLSSRPATHWVQQYQQSPYYRRYVQERLQTNQSTGQGPLQTKPSMGAREFFLRLYTLTHRCALIKLRDLLMTGILLAQAPVIAGLLAIVFGRDSNSENSLELVRAKPTAMFAATLAALWFGCSNAVREIIGEWSVYRRERMVGLPITAYVASKFCVLGAFCFLQCLVLVTVVGSCCNWKMNWLLAYVIIAEAALIGLAIGLLISAASRTSEMALYLLPLVLIPNFVLGGRVQPVHRMKFVANVAALMPTRWCYEGLLVAEARAAPLPSSRSPVIVPNAPNVPEDLADNDFPEDKRHNPGFCIVLMFIYLAGLVVAVHAVLRWRDIR